MKILLYNISKDVNSTALPSGEAVELTGNLRVPSSVENPVIEIEADALPNYNYAYIPAFSRYYWINNRGCSTNRLFVLSMTVDPLATFASEIGASTQYVLRAAGEFDGTITDMLYPTKNAWTEYKSEYNSPFNLDIDDCYWCVGIKGSGATNFYLFKPNGIDAFFEYLLKPGAGGYTEDALGNLSLALDSEAAVVVDPLQYISSVTCIPVDVGLSFVAGELITIGYVQDKFFYNCVKMDITSAQIATFTYAAPGHPDVARGTYLNNAPYANYYAYVPGFGKIDLDPSIVANNPITMTLRMDYRHGDCLLTISAGDAGIITRLTTSIGIPFEFSQVIAKGTSALTAANMAGGIVGNILSGNVEGVIGGATSAVKSAIENAIPSANSIGSNGSFAAIAGTKVQFVARYARPVAEDNEHRGRPLCAKRKINTLSGYIMTADAHMHPEGATTSEIGAIESAMNGGFYYE